MKTTTLNSKTGEGDAPNAMTNAQHSPLPWTLHADLDDNVFTIKSAWTATHKPGEAEGYGDYRGLTVCNIEHQGPNAPVVTERQANANAAYIVEACNNYKRVKAERDELLVALKAALNDIESLVSHNSMANHVRAAIVKAERE